jgi:hypothetical protein
MRIAGFEDRPIGGAPTPGAMDGTARKIGRSAATGAAPALPDSSTSGCIGGAAERGAVGVALGQLGWAAARWPATAAAWPPLSDSAKSGSARKASAIASIKSLSFK